MSVATNNLFALLSSENEDPQDLAAQLPVEKKPVAKAAAPEGMKCGVHGLSVQTAVYAVL